MTAPNHIKRLAWLLACVLAGLVIAVIGDSHLQSPIWYVAIPAVVAIGWMFLANPAECEPALHQQTSSAPGNEAAPGWFVPMDGPLVAAEFKHQVE